VAFFSVLLRLLRASVMSRYSLAAVAIFLCMLGLSCRRAATNVSDDAAAPLKWGADAEGGAPYIFLDPDDVKKTKGFEVDIATALSKAINRPIEFQQYSFESLELGVSRGDIDFAMNGLEVTTDRQETLRLSRPYYVYTLQLVARADETRFKTVEEFISQKRTMGALNNTAATRFCERKDLPRKTYDGQLEPFQDLELGRVDGVLLDLPPAIVYAKDNPKYRFIGEPIEPGYYSIAMQKDNEKLVATIDAGLESILKSGELRRIYEKWGMWNDAQDKLLTATSSEPAISGAHAGYSVASVFKLLFEGAQVTIVVSIGAMCLAMLIGLVVAICRLYAPLPIQYLAIVWVEFFRGIPVLLLLYVMYYGLPQLLNLDPTLAPSALTVAIIGFGLNYSAYEAEIYRAGISAVPIGQWEAAASLGMSKKKTFWRIILPQATRTILPPVTNDFVALFKDTSVASVITLVELTKQYQVLAKSSQRYMEIGLATALLYLVMSVPLGYLARRLEARWGKAL
jgi:polar amino acid transport system substrate-binding protein